MFGVGHLQQSQEAPHSLARCISSLVAWCHLSTDSLAAATLQLHVFLSTMQLIFIQLARVREPLVAENGT